MGRRLLAIAASASLVLFVVTCVLWIYSLHSTITLRQIENVRSVNVWHGKCLEWQAVKVLYPKVGLCTDVHILWSVPLWPVAALTVMLPLWWGTVNRKVLVWICIHATGTIP